MSLVLELEESREEAVQLGCLIAERIAADAEIPVRPAGLLVDVERAGEYDPEKSEWDVSELFSGIDR